jgi:hypothetical protein
MASPQVNILMIQSHEEHFIMKRLVLHHVRGPVVLLGETEFTFIYFLCSTDREFLHRKSSSTSDKSQLVLFNIIT